MVVQVVLHSDVFPFLSSGMSVKTNLEEDAKIGLGTFAYAPASRGATLAGKDVWP